MFAKGNLTQCYGNGSSRRDFSSSVKRSPNQLHHDILSVCKTDLLLWRLWLLFCCGDWIPHEDQGEVMWSAIPTYSICLDISYNIPWPNGKICTNMHRSSHKFMGKEGLTLQLFFFFSFLIKREHITMKLKGNISLWIISTVIFFVLSMFNILCIPNFSLVCELFLN